MPGMVLPQEPPALETMPVLRRGDDGRCCLVRGAVTRSRTAALRVNELSAVNGETEDLDGALGTVA